MATTMKADQTVTGLALNLLAAGASYFWYQVVFANFEQGNANLPTIKILQNIKIPLLGDIPYLGTIFFNHTILTYIAFLMVPVIWFFLYRTKYGLRIRGVGENPRAVDMKGLSVSKLQYAAVIFGGMMAGLGGAFLTVAASSRFVPDISGGRGWLAITIVIAGNWKPSRIVAATLIFAFLDAFQLQMQGIGIQVPYDILLALPYISAIVVLAVSRARSQAPAWLGNSYERE
jgi:simple sugar transport system permease protein